ncbi:hypothetical protein ElyMa_006026400 [Elysia marginata]|uniref:Uncharacterized protein n=1 Tax=Elysia marginata TaxID=1093978 RepID=A0AAV4GJY3_9GAST|nr:hypothetical protein ElyMa_006026400 [Elysia marginata]
MLSFTAVGLKFTLSQSQWDTQRSSSCGVLQCLEDSLIQGDDNPRNTTELILYQVIKDSLIQSDDNPRNATELILCQVIEDSLIQGDETLEIPLN